MPRRLFDFLTAPSKRVGSASAERQSRILSVSLLIALPLYAMMAVAAGLTRPSPVTPVDVGIGIGLFVGGLLAYALNRSDQYWRGGVVISVLAMAGALLVGYREPDPSRALSTLLFGLTGVTYASFMLSSRFTTGAAIGYSVCAGIASVLHPVVPMRDLVIADFLVATLSMLIVFGARLRASHVQEIRQMTDDVIESEARLRATLESALDAVVVLDPGGLVVEWGPHAEGLLGYTRGHAVGRPLVDLIDPESRSVELRERMAKVERGRFEVIAKSSAGHLFSCEISMAALSGGRGGAVFLRDVSERKRLQGQLVLADRMESMGRMVGGVAHELNNPLAYVVANLGYLAGELEAKLPSVAAAELLEVLGETQDGVKRVQRIVADLRTFSYGGQSEELHPVEVETTVESALQIATGHMRSEKVTLNKQLNGVGRVMAQESRLGQVFLNLLMNAVQAYDAPAPGMPDREITVASVREGNTVRVSVTDNGHGISPEVMRRLFTPFFTTKPVGQGTGLGLYISHTIIGSMKGEILVDSQVGKGSTFTVVLPGLDS